jgi:hypothetical protein
MIEPFAPPFLVGLLLGVLLGWLSLWTFLNPAVGRFCARIFSVVTLSVGAAFLVWAITSIALRESIRPLAGLNIVTETSEALAWGAGLLVAGIASLVLSFIGRRKTSCIGQGPRSASPA